MTNYIYIYMYKYTIWLKIEFIEITILVCKDNKSGIYI